MAVQGLCACARACAARCAQSISTLVVFYRTHHCVRLRDHTLCDAHKPLSPLVHVDIETGVAGTTVLNDPQCQIVTNWALPLPELFTDAVRAVTNSTTREPTPSESTSMSMRGNLVSSDTRAQSGLGRPLWKQTPSPDIAKRHRLTGTVEGDEPPGVAESGD